MEKVPNNSLVGFHIYIIHADPHLTDQCGLGYVICRQKAQAASISHPSHNHLKRTKLAVTGRHG